MEKKTKKTSSLRPNTGVSTKKTKSTETYRPVNKYRQRKQTIAELKREKELNQMLQAHKQQNGKAQPKPPSSNPRSSINHRSIAYEQNVQAEEALPLRNRLRSYVTRRVMIQKLSNAIHRPQNPITRTTHQAQRGALTFKLFLGTQPTSTGNSVLEPVMNARKFIWKHCWDAKMKTGINPKYLNDWLDSADTNSMVLVALVNSRKMNEDIKQAAAYVCCTFKSATHLYIDILCGKDDTEFPKRGIKNAPIALLYALEDVIHKRQMALGLLSKKFTISLTALPSVVRFYARLGFKRSPDACSEISKNAEMTMANNYRKETKDLYVGLGTHRPARLMMLAKFNGRFIDGNDWFYNNKNNVRPTGAMYQMSKCLTW